MHGKAAGRRATAGAKREVMGGEDEDGMKATGGRHRTPRSLSVCVPDSLQLPDYPAVVPARPLLPPLFLLLLLFLVLLLLPPPSAKVSGRSSPSASPAARAPTTGHPSLLHRHRKIDSSQYSFVLVLLWFSLPCLLSPYTPITFSRRVYPPYIRRRPGSYSPFHPHPSLRPRPQEEAHFPEHFHPQSRPQRLTFKVGLPGYTHVHPTTRYKHW
ncbi:hypothetical protein C8Q74DRAFT_654138 [Fomes fomentarius]|nr:hypothetical protein C8Q74DRAFT_654138 [Fomes fomentarius]